MEIHPIRNDSDHAAALAEIRKLWGAAAGTEDDGKLDILATLVERYEGTRWPVGSRSPGSLLCHEALHMASFLTGAIDEELCEHEAIKNCPEWLAHAQAARDALMELYQAIGKIHL